MAGLRLETAVAEAQVTFDRYPGGRRIHDLLIRGRCTSGSLLIGLEAKADETFGETIAQYERRAPGNATSRAHDECPRAPQGAAR
jgi:hypothetical protein